MELNIIKNLNCLEGLTSLPDNSIDCCVTSPPYWGLRDYGADEQIGLEETPELFIQKLVDVFSQVYRVLKPEGTLWLNIGDSYASFSGVYKDANSQGKFSYLANGGQKKKHNKVSGSLKQKDLVGIPWMLAFELRSYGWYLRQDIIWHKPNPMPESVTDRCTKSHEYIFLLSKSAKYYYDHVSIMQDCKNAEDDFRRIYSQTESLKSNPTNKVNGLRPRSWNGSTFDSGKTATAINNGRKSGNKERKTGLERGCPENNGSNVNGNVPWEGMKANKRSVWSVSTKPLKEAHFATFPQDLIVDCIKAGCPENGIVLDPFMGSGTTAIVAKKLNRNFIGFELNPEYIKIANKRLNKELGLFN